MKIVLLSMCATALVVATSNAQISKGSVLLGGSISASSGKQEVNNNTSRSNSVYLSPSIGLTVRENKVFGFRLGYGTNKTTYSASPYKTEGNIYSAGIFHRSYLPLGKSFFLFGDAGLGYFYRNSEISDITTSGSSQSHQKLSSISLTLFPGITYAVGQRFHLEASINNLFSLSYNTERTTQVLGTNRSKIKSNALDFSTNISSNAPLTLGFRFVLAKK